MIEPLTDLALTLAADSAAAGILSDQTAERFLRRASDFGIVFICIGMALCIWKILTGPTLVDRAIAGDTLAIHVVAFVILATIRFGSLVLFDAVLIVAILGFAGTVATAQYIGRRGTAT